MLEAGSRGKWRQAAAATMAETVAEATGRGSREDPHVAGTGGPAGNARLTAWTGLLLLLVFLAELATLLDVHGLISWHIVLGALLLPPALLKTASTGWRIARYYTGNRGYRSAGPPPMPLRLLGPAVVATTLGLLGSGILLVALGPDGSKRVLLSVVGQRVDWVTVHQGLFVLWAVATGLHVLGRLLPAIRLTAIRPAGGERVDGRLGRALVLVTVCGVAALTAALLLSTASSWRSGNWGFDDHHGAVRTSGRLR